MGLIIGGVVLALFILGYPIGVYNSVIRKKNMVETTRSTIDVMLKKRFDLIPNLVNTCREIMKHEASLFSDIVRLRQGIETTADNAEKIKLEGEMSGKLATLGFQFENYPELKSNENFLQLQESLEDVESNIAAARRTYNYAVTELRNVQETIPSNIVAGMMTIEEYPLFEVPEVERQNVRVFG